MSEDTQPNSGSETVTHVNERACVSTGTSFQSASPRRYTLGDRLGSGGFGSVYLADMQTALGHRQVVAKVLRASAEVSTERILDEGRAGIRLDHPGIAHVYDILPVEDGTMALVTSYIQGADLGRLRDLKHGVVHLPHSAVADVAAEVGFALAHAHERGVVHRDIKPANIVVSKAGVAILIDFGIATFEDKFAKTATGMVAGTPWYFTPEHLRDGAGPPADVAALAMVIYELWTGRRFLVSDPRAIVGLVADRTHYNRHLDERLQKIDNRRVAAILRQALAFEASDRPTARAFGKSFASMRLRGPSLRMWATDRTWATPPTHPGDLSGRVLELGTLPTGALELDETGQGTREGHRRWLWLRWAGAALVIVLLAMGGAACGLAAILLTQPGSTLGRTVASPSTPRAVSDEADPLPVAVPPGPEGLVPTNDEPRRPSPDNGPAASIPDAEASVSAPSLESPPEATAGETAAEAPSPTRPSASAARTSTPASTAEPGTFRAVGGVTSVELRSGLRAFSAGEPLEPGPYTVFVDFGGGFEPAHPSAMSAGAASSIRVDVLPGQTLSIRCRRALRRCDVEQP